LCYVFFFQAEDGIRDLIVTGVQTCALPISTSQESRQPISSPQNTRSRLGSPLRSTTPTDRAAPRRKARARRRGAVRTGVKEQTSPMPHSPTLGRHSSTGTDEKWPGSRQVGSPSPITQASQRRCSRRQRHLV